MLIFISVASFDAKCMDTHSFKIKTRKKRHWYYFEKKYYLVWNKYYPTLCKTGNLTQENYNTMTIPIPDFDCQFVFLVQCISLFIL